jgi:hypothetical protein
MEDNGRWKSEAFSPHYFEQLLVLLVGGLKFVPIHSSLDKITGSEA